MSRTYTILIADDDTDDQELISSALQISGIHFNIHKLQNGLQVLDFLLRRNSFKEVTVSPDLIFLDLNMPLLDGFEVLRGIRLHQALAELPIYVITVSKSDSDKKKAEALGATGFYSKGSRASDIARVVKEVLGKTFEIPGE